MHNSSKLLTYSSEGIINFSTDRIMFPPEFHIFDSSPAIDVEHGAPGCDVSRRVDRLLNGGRHQHGEQLGQVEEGHEHDEDAPDRGEEAS